MRPGRLVLTRALALLPLLLALPGAARAQSAHEAAATRMWVRLDAGRHDLVMEIGPLELPAGSGHRQLPAFHGIVPMNGWVHGFRVEMVDGEGREVPRATIHHVNVISPGQRELFSQIMLRVAAAGQETEPVSVPRMIGYRVRRGQELIVTAMVHNPTADSYGDVWLRVHLPWTPSNAVVRPVSVLPFYMDVMPPASLHAYDLPPGRSSRSWEGRPAVAGRVLGVGGHVHQYGTALRLEDVTTNTVIWEGRPVVDGEGRIVSMPRARFLWTRGVHVRPDHVYRLTAEYDNTSGRMIPGGAMGALAGLIVPDDPARWPRVDPGSPELKLDWRLVHTGNRGHQHGHAHPPSSTGGTH
jgi:hypothetical protein